MTDDVAGLIDIHSAWPSVRDELARASVRPAYELEIVQQDPAAWLDEVQRSLAEGTYRPGAMEVVEAPKAVGIVRPLAYVSIADRLVYSALVRACFPEIVNGLGWAQGVHDFAHQLGGIDNGQDWIQNRFTGWTAFRHRSLELLDSGFSYVVFTDIAAFYENIDISLLRSDLATLGVSNAVLDLLSRCLNRWAQVPGRGLPQGLAGSDLLAKVYLNPVDQALRNRGVSHIRYSDDMRLFCNNRTQAQDQLIGLARLLRKRGLNLQAAKSVIARSDAAREQIEGVMPVLRQILQKYRDDLAGFYDIDDPYAETFEIDAALQQNPDDAPIEAIRDAYLAYFVDTPGNAFDKSLYRFLLKRLGKAQDTSAVPHVRRHLEQHPQETETTISYLWALRAIESQDGELADFLRSEQGRVYPHQAYQVLRSIANSPGLRVPHVVAVARDMTLDPSTSRHLRGMARKLLGQHGEASDLEALQSQYESTGEPLERSQIMCATYRMERQRRNAFLSRAAEDGPLEGRAAVWVRSATPD